MDRTSWFRMVAVILVVVGLVSLATPPPAQAFDPQLAIALASAAGAIALIVGYLIVSNGREKQKAASLEGIYTCTEREASGPMGCGKGSSNPEPVAVVAAPESAPQAPMTADPRFTARADALLAIAQAHSCGGGQAAGPMGCDAPMGAASGYSSSASAPAFTAPTVQGQ